MTVQPFRLIVAILGLTVASLWLGAFLALKRKNKTIKLLKDECKRLREGNRRLHEENQRLRQEVLKQDRMKAIATLAAGMAHEIKNPLTVIKTFTEYLPQKYMEKGFIDKFVSLVKPQVERIHYFVKHLLRFAKLPAPTFAPSNIRQLLDDTLEVLNRDFVKHGIKVDTRFHDNTVAIFADPAQLKQAFLNLFLNSVDAMPQGGRLAVSTEPKDEFVEINVQDTGCGIQKVDLNRIFDPFYTTKQNGTGLGLTIIHNILDQHNTKLNVDSEPGKGTTFRVRFPLYVPKE